LTLAPLATPLDRGTGLPTGRRDLRVGSALVRIVAAGVVKDGCPSCRLTISIKALKHE